MKNPLETAAAIIRRGGLVIFPTETVYGLGADAFNPAAVKEIFRVKGRPADNPLIVHIADRKDLRAIVSSVPRRAEKLMAHFWPGPLTIIFKKKPIIPAAVTAGLETVAVRLPNHALARALIRAAGVPIAAPSANVSGRPSPTEAAHARRDLGKRVDFVLAAERSRYGLESTVVDVLTKLPLILRQGVITREDLEKVIGPVAVAGALSPARAPGMKHRHYAPAAPLVIPAAQPHDAAPVAAAVVRYRRRGRRVGVLGTRENAPQYRIADRLVIVGSRRNMKTCAGNLFKALQDFDRLGDVDVIVAETFPEVGIGAAIMERLRKAAQ